MNSLTAAGLASGLLRTTLALMATALVVWCLLRLAQCSSPRLHRIAWIVVLLQGWLLFRWGLNVPWYELAFRLPQPAAWDLAVAASMPPGEVPRAGISDQPQVLQPEPAESWNWQGILVAGWLLGMIVAVGRWLWSYVRFVRGLPLGTPADAVDAQAWRQLLAQRQVRREIPLRVTDGVGPILCRLPRGYRLLVPRTTWQGLSPEARLAVLRHELAHYERGDVWKSLAARLLALPHWFNPFAWWAVRNFDEGAEWACDDAVRRAHPEDTPAYGRALLALGAGPATQGMLNPAAQGRGLALRIQRLLTPNIREDSVMKKCLVIAIGLALLLAAGIRVRLVAREAADEQALRAEAAHEQAQRAFGSAAAKAHAQQARAMLDTAKRVYEIGMTAGSGEIPLDWYAWSRRWLDAERALAQNKNDEIDALTEHWKRMKRAQDTIVAIVRDGQMGKVHEVVVEYYVAEAEFWLVAAGGTVPDKPE